MSIYTQTVQGLYTALASGVRNSTQVINGKNLIDPNSGNPVFSTAINPEASGIIAYLNVTAVPGTDTLQLVLEEQDPASGVWTQVAATTANNATGMIRLKLKQAIAAIAATTTQVQVQDTLPPIWRLRVVHSGVGNFTYSLGIALYN
jgi:hypothetical protein